MLVVDDSRDGAESMADMLQILGHKVRTAHDGLEAIEAAGEFRPEVILMDIGMPRAQRAGRDTSHPPSRGALMLRSSR